MNKTKDKIICDLVYDYIEICKSVEKIISQESFQRLKEIRQITAQHLFPSANHTRFEHSLGVMHLAIKFFNKLKPQIIDFYKKQSINEKEAEKKSNFLFFHLKYAALLHDVGHAPYSHIGELFYDIEDIKKELNLKLSFNKLNINIDTLEEGSPHEWMSCYVICDNFLEILNGISEEVEIDLEFLFRIITGNQYKNENDSNLIISIINSKYFDVDKLDYLIRDNFMTGYTGIRIDLKRLLRSLLINKNMKLEFSKVGLTVLQRIIECRDSLYLLVYNHHTVVYTDYLYYALIKHIMKANNEEYLPKYISLNRLEKFENNEIIKKEKYFEDIPIERDDKKFFRVKYKLDKSIKDELLEKLKRINYLPHFKSPDSNDKHNNSITYKESFSPDAISQKKITDSDVNSLIRDNIFYSDFDLTSYYVFFLSKQLLHRKFLKPLWKTLSEFNKFLDRLSKDKSKELKDFLKNSSNKKIYELFYKLQGLIYHEVNLIPGEIILIPRANKFYIFETVEEFKISTNEGIANSLIEMQPLLNYNEFFTDVALFAYCREDKIDKVRKILFEKLSNLEEIYEEYDSIYN